MADLKITELDAATTIADTDVLAGVDLSEVTTKKFGWALVKSTLKTYFDTLYSTTANITDSTNKRFITDAQQTVLGNTSGTNSGNETTTTAGALVNGATAKTTPIDADYVGLMDSAASNILKKLSWANVKATLKTYFDGLYAPVGSVSILRNASVAAQTGFSSDTYLTGSDITIPTPGGWTVGAKYRCVFDMEKTAAGTDAFTVNVRIGTAGTTSDTAVKTISFTAGTAAADKGIFEVLVTVRASTITVQVIVRCDHHLAATGLITDGAAGTGIIIPGTGALSAGSLDTIGVSVNGGASFSGTCNSVFAELIGL